MLVFFTQKVIIHGCEAFLCGVHAFNNTPSIRKRMQF
jgi:hypothetical protein